MGYEGYPEFQKTLEEWVKGQLHSVQRIGATYGNSSQSEIINSVLTSDIEKINDTLLNLDPNAFETAISAIIKAENIYILGLRSCEPLAEFLAFYLNRYSGLEIR